MQCICTKFTWDGPNEKLIYAANISTEKKKKKPSKNLSEEINCDGKNQHKSIPEANREL